MLRARKRSVFGVNERLQLGGQEAAVLDVARLGLFAHPVRRPHPDNDDTVDGVDLVEHPERAGHLPRVAGERPSGKNRLCPSCMYRVR